MKGKRKEEREDERGEKKEDNGERREEEDEDKDTKEERIRKRAPSFSLAREHGRAVPSSLGFSSSLGSKDLTEQGLD